MDKPFVQYIGYVSSDNTQWLENIFERDEKDCLKKLKKKLKDGKYSFGKIDKLTRETIHEIGDEEDE